VAVAGAFLNPSYVSDNLNLSDVPGAPGAESRVYRRSFQRAAFQGIRSQVSALSQGIRGLDAIQRDFWAFPPSRALGLS